MSEQRRFRFGGVPVYNPQSLSKTEALAQFIVRQAAYLNLTELLREERPSHVLIIGARGMGKTTLLQRVRYGVEDDPELNARYLVLTFPEEQYNVSRLHQFLLNSVDALADSLERSGDLETLARVESFAGEAGTWAPDEIEDRTPRFLAEIGLRRRREFLLLVDNADRLFETIESSQQWKLRELLSARRDLTFFGATTQASEGIYSPDRAFFEFFKIEQLAPLTVAEVKSLLLRLSEAIEENENEKGTARRRVGEWLESDAARLRTLVQLTGGNPRTTVLLFHLVLDGLTGSAREYLEQMLDQVTPSYKGRVDDLPLQAQQVLDEVALRWDPVTAMEVAAKTGLETNAVSTQLTRLVRQGILEKADPGDSKKALYQVAERFFNIWYLMRASRRVRAKLRWFVEFLRVFFDSDELEQMARDRIERYRSTWRGHPEEVETAFAYVWASRAARDRYEHYLRQKCADTEEMWRPFLDLLDPALTGGSQVRDSSAKAGLKTDATRQVETEEELRHAIESEPANAEKWKSLGRLLAQKAGRDREAHEAYLKALELDPTCAQNWAEFGSFLSRTPNRGHEAEAAFRKAIELEPNAAGYWNDLGGLLAKIPDRAAEAEVACRKAIELLPNFAGFWANLGGLLAETPERAAEAEAAYRKAIELDPNIAGFWNNLGTLLTKIPERAADAETAYRKAIELDPNVVWFWANLGGLLAETADRTAEAEAAYRKAIELDPNLAWFWNNLGGLLAKTPDRAEEAEAAYRKAIELDPNLAWFWNNLGGLLAKTPDRAAEAESACRKAIELDPNLAWFWANLGGLLAKTPDRAAQAELAYRKAIELDPNFAGFWDGLAGLLAETPDRAAGAESAYRKAIGLDPNFARFWNNLGSLLAKTPDRAAEAESAYRKAIELDPNFARFWANLGGLLAKTPDRATEAEAAYRKATKLQPEDPLFWAMLAVFLACKAGKPEESEIAFLNSLLYDPNHSATNRNLGVLLYCELSKQNEAIGYLARAHELDPKDPISEEILRAVQRDSVGADEPVQLPYDATRESAFWDQLRDLCDNYPPFGKILVRICDLVQERDSSNRFAKLYRALALAQLGDFPRASVALEDALISDPIDLLSIGRRALELFFAAAVKCDRVRDCLDLIEKKDWVDAWRPIHEALRAVKEGSAEYLKRVAVEIRGPAQEILRRIAPNLPHLK